MKLPILSNSQEVQNNYSNEPSTSEERAEKDQVDEFAAEPVEDAIVEINTKSDKKMVSVSDFIHHVYMAMCKTMSSVLNILGNI